MGMLFYSRFLSILSGLSPQYASRGLPATRATLVERMGKSEQVVGHHLKNLKEKGVRGPEEDRGEVRVVCGVTHGSFQEENGLKVVNFRWEKVQSLNRY